MDLAWKTAKVVSVIMRPSVDGSGRIRATKEQKVAAVHSTRENARLHPQDDGPVEVRLQKGVARHVNFA